MSIKPLKIKIKKELPFVSKTLYKTYNVNGVFNTDELMKALPFVDLNNTEYFECIYDTMFKFGDKVMYTGNSRHIGRYPRFIITAVYAYVKNNKLYEEYTIAAENDTTCVYTMVKKDELKINNNKFIISFSNSICDEHPAIHEIDEVSFNKKIKGTYKELFVFDTYNKALEAAKKLSNVLYNEL